MLRVSYRRPSTRGAFSASLVQDVDISTPKATHENWPPALFAPAPSVAPAAAPTPATLAVKFLELRAVPLSEVERFHAEFPGYVCVRTQTNFTCVNASIPVFTHA